MTYKETIEYLYSSAPLFQNIGAGAYKEGLSNTHILDDHFGNPHTQYRTVHVAGTNGKGSVSHTIAAILQNVGLKVGLYTSPHLKDFRERIRVNGVCVPEEYVVDFVEKERGFFEPLHPSFFELTTAMAFRYFADEKVDVAVVEVGLGGRLDCTNIITPDLSIVTNISYDHVQFLGDTLEKIATEKAGIIKHDIPVVIGESISSTVDEVFINKAEAVGTSIVFADKMNEVDSAVRNEDGTWEYATRSFGTIKGELGGFCQVKNTATILAAVKELRRRGYDIDDECVRQGFANVTETTGLMGRWQTISKDPLTICDTGHNVGGMQYIAAQLEKTPQNRLHIVLGMVNDKDVDGVLSLLPTDAVYYFTQASVKRAMPSEKLMEKALAKGLKGNAYRTVADAYAEARKNARKEDLIFVGGSTFVVSDMLNNTY